MGLKELADRNCNRDSFLLLSGSEAHEEQKAPPSGPNGDLEAESGV